MKTKFVMIFSLALALSATMGCGKKKALANPHEETPEVTMPAPEIDKLVIDENFVPPRENGRFEVESMMMEDNLLKLRVAYSGGCEEHFFNLYSNGMYAKSYPPQLTLFLEHIDNNDRCRAWIVKELVFDISDAEYPGTNEVVIRMNNTDKTARFKY